MKAYRMTILVMDHEERFDKRADIIQAIEDFDEVSMQVISTKTVDIGEFTDDHPLNRSDSKDPAFQAEYKRLFGSK